LLALSFVALHTSTFGARSSVNPSGFLGGAPATCSASHGYPLRGLLFAPCPQLRCVDVLKSRSQATLVPPSNTATQRLGNPVTRPRFVPARAVTSLCEAGSRGLQSNPGARATPPLAPTDAGASSRFGAFTSKAPTALFSFSCSPLECGGSPCTQSESLGRFVTSWVSRWTRSPHPTGGSPPRQPQPTNKERNQSVSGSERKPSKGRRLKHILDTALPCDAKLNSDGCERIKSPLLSYRRR
jgi:hypothetical protein